MKNKKRKLTEAEKKDVDRFAERFAEILVKQIDYDAANKKLPGNERKR